MLNRTQILDLNSAFFGVSEEELMEEAGHKSAQELAKNIDLKGKKVQILCGLGNNGGDGFVMARYLKQKNCEVEVILIGKEKEIKTDLARRNWRKIPKNIVKTEYHHSLKCTADIVVDAILGVGIKGDLREPIKSLIKKVNRHKAFKVSLDLPTGIATKSYFKPDLIITFHYLKPELVTLKYQENIKIVVLDIGIPAEAEYFVGPGDLIANIPVRVGSSHKGENGKVLIIGGSSEYHGAPIICSLGAVKSGSDLVYLYGPESNFDVNRKASYELIVKKYPGTELNQKALTKITNFANSCDAVVIGPGLGKKNETLKAIKKLIAQIKKPLVIDADAILPHAQFLDIFKGRDTVITPHKGEFMRMTGVSLKGDPKQDVEIVAEFAKNLQATILLKGEHDLIVSSNGHVKFNVTGNPGLTKGGTGDILSGLVGGLMAQGVTGYKAAQMAAFWLGYTGDLLAEEKPNYTAKDILDYLGTSLKKIINYKL